MSNENKEITGNIGEWSEIYTLLKLLGEGKVYAGISQFIPEGMEIN